MLDKIKKLVESTNYDDNRLALILIVENYNLEELFNSSIDIFEADKTSLCGDMRYLNQFGINKDVYPNGIVLENGFSLYMTKKGPVGLDKGYKGDTVENGIGFIRWELNKNE